MTPTKAQQAQEYAEKKLQARRPNSIHPLEFNKRTHTFDYNDIQQAYLDGNTACEQSIWRSVEDELPEFGRRVLICERVADRQKVFIGRRIQFSNGDWGWSQSTKESVTHWRELPSLPETNTEKK